MRVMLLANWGLGLEIAKALHRLDHVEVAAVATQFSAHASDRWVNAVFDFAQANRYPVFDQKDLTFEKLHALMVESEADLLISHAFMRIIPERVYSVPKYGAVNIHASLLPKYRGPAPTYWVLKNREETTGLTCHLIDQGVDTGDIILQTRVAVRPDDTFATLVERFKKKIPQFMNRCLDRIQDDSFQPVVQDHELATYAPKPEKTEDEYETV